MWYNKSIAIATVDNKALGIGARRRTMKEKILIIFAEILLIGGVLLMLGTPWHEELPHWIFKCGMLIGPPLAILGGAILGNEVEKR